MEAGIEAADLLIAVTDSDELNLLCCTVAKHVSRCDTIARVRTPDYSTEASYLREKLGLTMIINPELEAAIEATRILCLPTALEVNSFAHGQAELIKFKISEGNMLGRNVNPGIWQERNCQCSYLHDRKRWRSLYSVGRFCDASW